MSNSEHSVREVVQVRMPTDKGEFTLWAFDFDGERDPTLALTCGEIRGQRDVPVRLHSSCLTGDVFGSARCDCGPQLQAAINLISARGAGMVIYLHQEGRGIGLLHKLRAYKLQELGLDTVEANEVMGLPADCREYSAAVQVLRFFDIQSIKLMTNNPEKQRCLEEGGVQVSGVIPVHIEPNPNNLEYLRTKATKMGHMLPEFGATTARGAA